jgi:hypothetical protein
MIDSPNGTNGDGTDPGEESDFEAFWSVEDLERAEQRRQERETEEGRPNGANGANGAGTGPDEGWPDPDMGVLNERDPAVDFPVEAFGDAWADWITDAAEAAICPPDYVAAPLLSAASVLIGNARWIEAWPGWISPPHLWTAAVGLSGDGKTPGSRVLTRAILPEMEHRMRGDYDDRLADWKMENDIARAAQERWKKGLRAEDADKSEPRPADPPPMPEVPRLLAHDVTVERLALILATSAPKGLLIPRDELAGWALNLDAYNSHGRQFWMEGYDGNPHTVDRVKYADKILIPHHAVSIYGSIQPDRLVELQRAGDDGLLGRFLWFWPDPVPFRRGQRVPGEAWAIECFDRLRQLDLMPGTPPEPVIIPLSSDAADLLEKFGASVDARRGRKGRFIGSAFGKARGHALRLSTVIAHLWWSATRDLSLTGEATLKEVSQEAVAAACILTDEYFLPMAARVFTDAALPETERCTTALARWITQHKEMPKIINAREVRRHSRIPGLREAEKVEHAIKGLVEAGWLIAKSTRAGGRIGRQRSDYEVNPKLKRAQRDE